MSKIRSIKAYDGKVYDIHDARIPAFQEGKELECHDGVYSGEDIPTEDPSIARLVEGSITTIDIEDVEAVREYFCADCKKVKSLQLNNIQGLIEDKAFYGLTEVENVYIDPENNITELGADCFAGLGMNRENNKRFILDFRNSSFEYFQGFGALSKSARVDSGVIITPEVPGIALSNADLYLPNTVIALFTPIKRDSFGSATGSSGGVLNNCENIDVFITTTSTLLDVKSIDVLPADDASHIFVPFDLYGKYMQATNGAGVENLYAGADNTLFAPGVSLPKIDTFGYEITGSSDRAHKEIIKKAIEGEMFAKHTGNRLFTLLELENSYKGTLDIILNGRHYKPGDLLPLDTEITIIPKPLDGGEVLKTFTVNNINYKNVAEVILRTDERNITAGVSYDVALLPKYLGYYEEDHEGAYPEDFNDQVPTEDELVLNGALLSTFPGGEVILDDRMVVEGKIKTIVALYCEGKGGSYSFSNAPISRIEIPESVRLIDYSRITTIAFGSTAYLQEMVIKGKPIIKGSLGDRALMSISYGGTREEAKANGTKLSRNYRLGYGTNRLKCLDGDISIYPELVQGNVRESSSYYRSPVWDYLKVTHNDHQSISNFYAERYNNYGLLYIREYEAPQDLTNDLFYSDHPGALRCDIIKYPGTKDQLKENLTNGKWYGSGGYEKIVCADGEECYTPFRVFISNFYHHDTVTVNGLDTGATCSQINPEIDMERSIKISNPENLPLSFNAIDLGTDSEIILSISAIMNAFKGNYAQSRQRYIDGPVEYNSTYHTLDESTLTASMNIVARQHLTSSSSAYCDFRIPPAIVYEDKFYRVTKATSHIKGTNYNQTGYTHNMNVKIISATIERIEPDSVTDSQSNSSTAAIFDLRSCSHLMSVALTAFYLNGRYLPNWDSQDHRTVLLPKSVEQIVGGPLSNMHVIVDNPFFHSVNNGSMVLDSENRVVWVSDCCPIAEGPTELLPNSLGSVYMPFTIKNIHDDVWSMNHTARYIHSDNYNNFSLSALDRIGQYGNVASLGDYAGIPCLVYNTALKHIGAYLYATDNRQLSGTYLGTTAEWEMIDKNPNWYKSSRAHDQIAVKRVICLDGVITLG